MNDLEMMSLIVAGACHDHEHPGFNNVYLVESRDPIAIRYNGKLIYFLTTFRCICIRKPSYCYLICCNV